MEKSYMPTQVNSHLHRELIWLHGLHIPAAPRDCIHTGSEVTSHRRLAKADAVRLFLRLAQANIQIMKRGHNLQTGRRSGDVQATVKGQNQINNTQITQLVHNRSVELHSLNTV